MSSPKCVSGKEGRLMTHKPLIATVIAIGLIVMTTFCTESFAQDQTQALIEAAKKGDLEQVRDLLDEGADVNAKNGDGLTALMAAAETGNLDVVKFLIEKGADVNARENTDVQVTASTSLKGFSLKRFGQVSIETGGTALWIAQQRGHKEIVELLKAHRAKE